MDAVKGKSDSSLPQSTNNENKDWALLERIARAFQLNFSSENYSERESQCFEAALRACEKKNWHIIETHQVDIAKITDIAGRTLFMRAVADWKEDWVIQLLKYKSLVHQKDSEGNTPLHIAAETGATHLLPMLFKDIGFDSKNNAGETPIHKAIYHGQEEVLRAFLENGANTKLSLTWKNLKVTPLCFAVLRGEIGCIDLLLKKSNFQQTVQGIGNILHVATHFHQPHVIEHLLEKYKVLIQPLIEMPNENDLTPLVLAAILGETEVIWTLKEHGADLESEDSLKRMPLHHAALACQLEVIELLAYFNVNPSAVDRSGKTPLALAESKRTESPEAESTYGLLHNLSNSWGVKTTLSKHSPYSTPENLVFKGGGPKGSAYVGVLNSLDKRGLLKGIKRVAGTSSGAITATLVSLGYTAKETEDLLINKDLMDFIDHPLSKTSLKEASSTLGMNLTTLRTCYDTIQGVTNGSLVLDIFKKMYNTTGVCKGESFRLWIEDLISSKVAEVIGKNKEECAYLTFGELRKFIEQGKPFKHIHVFGTKLGNNPETIEFSSEDPSCDNYIISDAIRISMSIPLVFEAHCIHIKQGTDRVCYEVGGSFVDGGVLYNLPIETFDRKKYQTQKDLEEEGNCPQFNKKTIGFNLCCPEKPVTGKDNAETIGALLIGIAAAYSNAEQILRKLNPYNKGRIIEIDIGDTTALSFNLNGEQKQALVQTGFDATEKFFSQFDSIPSLTPFITPSGMEKIIKGRLDLPSISPTFVGRKALLSKLKKDFLFEQWKPTHSTIVKILHGLGGIGKSELAITFGNKNEAHFSLIWFIPCGTPELYEQSYKELAKALKIPCEKDPAPLIIEKVHKSLASGIDGKKPWLLIFDNVEKQIKSEQLPQRGGCVLITSQSRTIWENPNDFQEILPFIKQECEDFFKLVAKEEPSDLLGKVIQELEGYPVLINLAAKSIEKYLSLKEYLETIQSKGAPLLEIEEGSRYPKALGKVFQTHFEQIKDADPLSYEFLELCAFLNPDCIPAGFLEFCLKKKNSNKRKEEILKTLCDSSVMRFDKVKEILSLHHLQQKILKMIVNQEKYIEAIHLLAKWSENFNSNRQDSWKIGAGCFLQIDELEKCPFWEKVGSIEKAQILSQSGAWVMKIKGGGIQALELHKKALVLRRKEFGEEHPDVATSLNNVGCIFGDLGKHEEALKYKMEALMLWKKLLGGENSHVATSLNNVGSTFRDLGKYEEAQKYLMEALVLWKKLLRDEHPYVAASLNNVGSTFRDLGKHEEALKYLVEALVLWKKLLGDEHPHIATGLNNVGCTFAHLGKHEEALKYQMESLVLRKKLLGEEHPDVAMSLNNIGSTFGDLGKHEEALKYQMEASKIFKQNFKEDHPMVLEVLKNIQMIQSELEANKDGWFTKQNIALGLLALGGIASYFYYKSKSEK